MKKTLTTLSLCAIALGAFASTASAAKVDEVTTKGEVGFTADSTPPSIVDPNPDPNPDPDPDPDPGPLPGEDGPLRFDTLPTLNFGTDNKLATGAQTYYAHFDEKDNGGGAAKGVYPTYFSVTDLRGGTQGWTVTVYNDGVFTNKANAADKINGKITLKDSSIESASFDPTANAAMFPVIKTGELHISESQTVELVNAAAGANGTGQGYGKWSVGYGRTDVKTSGQGVDGNGSTGAVDTTKEGRNPAVRLDVPAQIINTGVNYETNLVWALNDTL